jgi:hypothetical protein
MESKPMENTERNFKLFEEFARQRCGIPTLRTQNSDRLDFHEIAVWTLLNMMQDAYDAGFKAGSKQKS